MFELFTYEPEQNLNFKVDKRTIDHLFQILFLIMGNLFTILQFVRKFTIFIIIIFQLGISVSLSLLDFDPGVLLQQVTLSYGGPLEQHTSSPSSDQPKIKAK